MRSMVRAHRHLVAAAVGVGVGVGALGLQAVRAEIRRPPGDHVEMRGDGALLNVARRVAEGYMGEHPQAVVAVSGGGSYRGVKSVLQGTADVALVTGEIGDDLQKLGRDRAVKLVKHDVYRDAVVVVVHRSSPIEDLSRDQLRDIYRGALTNWKAVGGPDAPIAVVSHEPALGVYDTFKRQVLGDDAVITPAAHTVTMRELRESITPFAIAYLGIHMVGQYEAGPSKVIKVGGVAATTETLVSGKYPIQRLLSIYHREDAPPPVQRIVADFTSPEKGQAIVRSLGDVPAE